MKIQSGGIIWDMGLGTPEGDKYWNDARVRVDKKLDGKKVSPQEYIEMTITEGVKYFFNKLQDHIPDNYRGNGEG